MGHRETSPWKKSGKFVRITKHAPDPFGSSYAERPFSLNMFPTADESAGNGYRIRTGETEDYLLRLLNDVLEEIPDFPIQQISQNINGSNGDFY